MAATPALFADHEERFSDDAQIRVEATRYVFFAGDLLTPERKRDREDFARGGEEYDSLCLVRTRRFIPRCAVVPLETSAQFVTRDQVPDGVRTLRFPTTPPHLFGLPAYPGEHIIPLAIVPSDASRGIVELSALADSPWESGLAQSVQEHFFPAAEEVPIELRRVEDIITHRASLTRDERFRRSGEQMLESCRQFRAYAQARIDREHALLKEGKAHQYVYTYSPLARVLLAQLEIAPQDQAFQLLADSQSKLINGFRSSGLTPEMLAEMNAQQQTNFQQMLSGALEGLGSQIAAAIVASRPSPAPKGGATTPQPAVDKSGK